MTTAGAHSSASKLPGAPAATEADLKPSAVVFVPAVVAGRRRPYHQIMASPAKRPASWGFDATIRYELAEEILSLLRTDSGRRLRQAQARDPADAGEVAKLANAHTRYTELRASVHRCTPEQIEALIAEHGPRARAVAGTSAS
jgi:hypothetical protein